MWTIACKNTVQKSVNTLFNCKVDNGRGYRSNSTAKMARRKGWLAHIPKDLGLTFYYCRRRGYQNCSRIPSTFNQQEHPGFVCTSHYPQQACCAMETRRNDNSENAATCHPHWTQLLNGHALLFLFVPTARRLKAGKWLRSMVPRDGVEPPTPAFSGLRSTT